MSVSKHELWKSRYVNALNQDCGMSGYSDAGRPLIKGHWTKKKWQLGNLDDNTTKYCCYKSNNLDAKTNERECEQELCMNCASWLDKYHRELNTRTAEERGMETLVPLLEQIIENQNKLQKGLNDMCELLSVIARNTEHQSKKT